MSASLSAIACPWHTTQRNSSISALALASCLGSGSCVSAIAAGGSGVSAIAGAATSSARATNRFIAHPALRQRSEEHTSELQSLMRISYAVFCLKKKTKYQKSQPSVRVMQTSKYKHGQTM